MLLHEALVHTECPICLQPLDYRLRPPPSHPTSTLSCSTSATVTAGRGSTTRTSASGSSPLQLSGPSAAGGAGEFRITFAPGVYGNDAADPWHPNLAVSPPAPPHAVPGFSDESSFAHNESRLHFSGGGSEFPGNGHSGSSDEGAAGVVVLPCGHLLHYLCAMQLCEYAAHLSCPVCRLKLASDADVVLLRPQLRGSSVAAAQAPADLPSRCSNVEGTSMSSTALRKRSRAEGVGEEGEEARHANSKRADGSATDSSQLSPLVSTAQRVCFPDRAVAGASTAPSGRERRVATPLWGHDEAPKDTGAVPVTQTLLSVSRQKSSVDVDASPGEDDITIVGARQLPPSQAYAELLLRTTATWADRAETLKERVEHLERSRQLLQNDCSGLERTLTVARRRREVLLNTPSSKDAQDALRSAQRLRELQRLCLETRAAITTTTAQLAEAIRDHAEVRRQTEKYTRKLSRLEGRKGHGGTGGDTAAVVRADPPLMPSP
ncbi:hypothetical protein LSCM1_04124 [Leishmania martiniquensis]|uniref:RING-type domain-containing protein n=1 Tax=Leishmania martiniquensis TaxID=1580590 RepID=A0A836KHR1_9TRYP|nr:hypothetical protein LSCM1_04124 [Leishmania martiniquensis]